MKNPYPNRLEKLEKAILEERYDLLAINSGVSQVYFTGLHFHLSERPAVLLVGKGQEPAFLFPEFETDKVKSASIKLRPFSYSENTSEWGKAFGKAVSSFGIDNPTIGVEPNTMRFLEMDLFHIQSPKIQFASASQVLSDLRSQKDVFEVEAIQQAIQIAERALLQTIPFIKKGKSEKEIANELVINLLREGSEPELPFSPIVASGPNSANPHAVPGERLLSAGDLLIIDYGARCNGYISDITRTFAVGEIDSQSREIYETVKEANESARSASKGELIPEKIDKKARSVIMKAGYGDFFIHRTGHGIGMEPHEAPYISMGNTEEIKPGNTFTIEPGIYLPGKGGVRIEDNMFAIKNGLKTLTSLDRNLITI